MNRFEYLYGHKVVFSGFHIGEKVKPVSSYYDVLLKDKIPGVINGKRLKDGDVQFEVVWENGRHAWWKEESLQRI